MRKNLLQIGFSVIMGWIIMIVCFTVIQPIIHPGGEEVFFGMLLLGLGLLISGIILKSKERFNSIRKTLLQIGVVLTIIWIQILVMREGPHGLGFYLGYTATRYGFKWGDMFYSIRARAGLTFFG
jgi:hypothetical protein